MSLEVKGLAFCKAKIREVESDGKFCVQRRNLQNIFFSLHEVPAFSPLFSYLCHSRFSVFAFDINLRMQRLLVSFKTKIFFSRQRLGGSVAQ